MKQVANQSNLDKDDLIFHFVPDIGESTLYINDDVKQYVNHFFDKISVECDIKPNSIRLVGDIPTLINVIGRLVQDYEKYKGLNEEFTLIL